MNFPRGKFRLLALVGALLLAAVLVARRCAPGPAPFPTPPPPDTAPAAVWRTRALAAERAYEIAAGREEGLRERIATLAARLQGQTARQLEVGTLYDTAIDLSRDTAALQWSMDQRGRLTVDVALPADSGRYHPATTRPVDVGDCDDGLAVRGLDVVCDRARLGHLTLLGRAGLAAPLTGIPPPAPTAIAEGGIRWERSYRSPVAVELVADRTRRARITLEWGVQLF